MRRARKPAALSEGEVAYLKARRHLARRDPILKSVIRGIGPCTLRPNPNRFATIVHSIVAQQISGKVARSISSKLEALLAPEALSAQAIRSRSAEQLRAAGLSAAKVRSVLDLSEKIYAREVDLDAIHQGSDDEIIASLIPVRGIGPWTAQMFLIFSLGRLDVLPVNDLGLRVGVQRHYGLGELPAKDELIELAEPWRPYRSVATWYIWRSLGGVPQSD